MDTCLSAQDEYEKMAYHGESVPEKKEDKLLT